jgi:hypothetical protein
MVGSLGGVFPVFLLSLMLFVVLVVAQEVYRVLRLHSLMNTLAYELHLQHNHPIIFRPPVVNGFYQGRDVAFDVVGDDIRVRVFHINESNEEFTVGTLDYFRRRGPSGAIRLDIGNDSLERAYLFRGTRMSVLKKFMDERLQRRLDDSGISFTVGRRDVSSSLKTRTADKAHLKLALDFLVEAAAKADRL